MAHDETIKSANKLPGSLRAIGKHAFAYCINLETIGLNEGLTTIGDEAFIGCKRLEEIVIPSTLTHLGKGVFRGCDSLVTIVIKSDLFAIDAETFSGLQTSVQFYVVNESIQKKLIDAGINPNQIHIKRDDAK